MPREVFLTAAREPTLADLERACLRVDPSIRVTDAGAYWRVLAPDGEAVATLDRPRFVEDGRLATQVGRGLWRDAGLWWVEGVVPWALSADPGVEVLRALAAETGADLVVQDGR